VCVKSRHAKFQRFIARGTFLNSELNKRRGQEKCAFFDGNVEIWPIESGIRSFG